MVMIEEQRILNVSLSRKSKRNGGDQEQSSLLRAVTGFEQ